MGYSPQGCKELDMTEHTCNANMYVIAVCTILVYILRVLKEGFILKRIKFKPEVKIVCLWARKTECLFGSRMD